MGWRRTKLVLIGVLLLPGSLLLAESSWALDLDGALRASTEYDSNVRRTDGPGHTDDVVFRITPLVRLVEDDGKFHWNIDYRFPYEFAVNTTRIDGFRHFLNAKGDYFLSERTRFYASDQFSKSDALSQNGGTAPGDVDTIGSFRAPVWRNRATLGVNHLFTPRVSSDLSFTHRYFDTNLLNRSQTDVFVGSARMNYMLSARHRVGGGASGTFQDFSENNAGTRPASQSFFLNLFASWAWMIDETTNLEVAGGPTYVDTQEDAPPPFATVPVVPTVNGGTGAFLFDSCSFDGTAVFAACGPVPVALSAIGIADAAVAGAQTIRFSGPLPQSNSNSWNFFANLALSKRWTPVHNTRLSYRRTDSTSSGLGASVLDAVGLTHAWKFAERWSTSFRADFTHRKSSTDQSVTLVEVVSRTVENGCSTSSGGSLDCDLAQTSALISRESSNAIDTNRWGVSTQLAHRLTRHIEVGLRYRFNQQLSADGTLGSPSDFGDHLVTLGVQYDFDRYSLDKYVPW